MRTMFVGGFGAAGHSYWMGQLEPLKPMPMPTSAPATPSGLKKFYGYPQDVGPGATGAPGAPGAPIAPADQSYTIPVINQQVPATIFGLPAKTVVIGGAVVVGGIILMHVL